MKFLPLASNLATQDDWGNKETRTYKKNLTRTRFELARVSPPGIRVKVDLNLAP